MVDRSRADIEDVGKLLPGEPGSAAQLGDCAGPRRSRNKVSNKPCVGMCEAGGERRRLEIAEGARGIE
jgi:hypothetical protein